MVVRKQAALPKQYIYNAAIVGFVVVSGAFAFRFGLNTERVPGCVERASLTAPLPVSHNGSNVSLVDLRARSRGPEWGLDDNLGMRWSEDGRRAVLDVSFRANEGKLFRSQRRHIDVEGRTSGIGFDWDADALDGRTVGCLSFAVKVPDTFPKDSDGVLPGLVVAEQSSRGMTVETIGRTLAFPMRWRQGGRLGLRIEPSAGAQGREFKFDIGIAALTPGRWHMIEQEVTLSGPGRADGKVRVWVNGDIVLEREELRMVEGSTAPLRFSNAAVRVHFSDGHAAWNTAPAAATVSVRGLTLHGL